MLASGARRPFHYSSPISLSAVGIDCWRGALLPYCGVVDKNALVARAEYLGELHARNRPLVLPTVWDAWSARMARWNRLGESGGGSSAPLGEMVPRQMVKARLSTPTHCGGIGRCQRASSLVHRLGGGSSWVTGAACDSVRSSHSDARTSMWHEVASA